MPHPGPVTPTHTRPRFLRTLGSEVRGSQRSAVVQHLSFPHPWAATPSRQMTETNAQCQDCSPRAPTPFHRDAQWKRGGDSPGGLMGRAQGLLGAPTARTKSAGAASPRGWSISSARWLRLKDPAAPHLGRASRLCPENVAASAFKDNVRRCDSVEPAGSSVTRDGAVCRSLKWFWLRFCHWMWLVCL